MKKNFLIAVLMTIATTILLGIIYPLLITGLAQLLFPEKANGQLIQKDGQTIGSRIIGQPFVSDKYFHSRPSAAGNGYDASNSSGSNLGPTNRKLLDRMRNDLGAVQADNPAMSVPVDLVTASASGLDPDITPAAAFFQVPRIARVRSVAEDQVRALVDRHIEQRQFGILGEPRVNVLEINLELDQRFPGNKQAKLNP
ncbi:MAG: potassium-transporting ATPase subunit KdpC [Acidobacteria bacterium]|nr:potassium-transporting ATPase subunit KdpC [Acidobacteriota bacterium]